VVDIETGELIDVFTSEEETVEFCRRYWNEKDGSTNSNQQRKRPQ
jgi:hypothetical protein